MYLAYFSRYRGNSAKNHWFLRGRSILHQNRPNGRSRRRFDFVETSPEGLGNFSFVLWKTAIFGYPPALNGLKKFYLKRINNESTVGKINNKHCSGPRRQICDVGDVRCCRKMETDLYQIFWYRSYIFLAFFREHQRWKLSFADINFREYSQFWVIFLILTWFSVILIDISWNSMKVRLRGYKLSR